MDSMGDDQTVPKRIFAAGSGYAGPCAIRHCHGGESRHHYGDQDSSPV